jgi:ubiquinone/menaquinone biosynthesis C-methylase UbiE
MKKTGAKGDSYYGRVAENYENRRAKQGWWKVEQKEMFALLETLPKGLSVVDIPFGTGRFVPFYLERGFTIHGMDASNEMLKSASEILGEDFKKCAVKTGSAMDLEYADGQFDLLVSTRFLRDIIVSADAKKALSEFARVTSKYAIIQLGQNTKDNDDPADPEVILASRLSEKGNVELLKDSGFRILEKRLVKSDPEDDSEIFHFLCEKI